MICFLSAAAKCNQKPISKIYKQLETFSLPPYHARLCNFSDGLNTCVYNTHVHSCIHSCALLQQCTVAISPALASSSLCDCYWKCSAATGASSWRIYMTQVHTLESTHVCVHTHTHTHIRRHASGPARKD